MAITIDWKNRIIHVPKDFMTLIQVSPTEIRELDTDLFRLALKDLEDDPAGMAYPDTHRHIAGVSVGGVTLARVVEIIEPYTVTFEDGQYAVNLTRSNNNIGDRVNVNQVSVRSSNSAGLMQTAEIEFGTFDNGVSVDVLNGVSGTAYPTGTRLQPVNNIQDAMFIANLRGFSKLYILGDIVLDTGDDVSNMLLVGNNAARTFIQINTGSNTLNTEIIEATVTGILDGNSIIRNSYVFDLEYVNGFLHECELAGTIVLGGNSTAHIMGCFAETNYVTIDMSHTGNPLNVQAFSGDIKFINKNDSSTCGLHLISGFVHLDSSITDVSNIHLAGSGSLLNNTGQDIERNNIVNGSTLNTIEKILRNKTVTDPNTGIMTVYADDGITPLLTAQLYENTLGTQNYRGQGAERRERLE